MFFLLTAWYHNKESGVVIEKDNTFYYVRCYL